MTPIKWKLTRVPKKLATFVKLHPELAEDIARALRKHKTVEITDRAGSATIVITRKK